MRAAPRPILRGCGGCSCAMVDIVSCRRKPHNLENMAWIQLRHTGEKKDQLLLSSQPPAPVLVPQPCAAAAAKDDFPDRVLLRACRSRAWAPPAAGTCVPLPGAERKSLPRGRGQQLSLFHEFPGRRAREAPGPAPAVPPHGRQVAPRGCREAAPGRTESADSLN